jgi:hypothetical protein
LASNKYALIIFVNGRTNNASKSPKPSRHRASRILAAAIRAGRSNTNARKGCGAFSEDALAHDGVKPGGAPGSIRQSG